MSPRLRRVVMFLLAVVIVCLVWEGYKALGQATGDEVFGLRLPARTDDASMPHVYDIVRRFFEPENRAISTPVGVSVIQGCWYTFRIALAGFAIGVTIGLALAIAMQRFHLAEKGLLPYIVLSQTVPLVALAPVVVGWAGSLSLFGLEWEAWMSVALIAAYLAFFPVAVGALKGLQSPPPESVELMDSYAASWWSTLVKLRFPASVPYLVPALKLAAASAVVGAVVAEISTGTRGGVGRLIIEYSREGTGDPVKVFTAILGAAFLGLLVAGMIALIDLALMRNRPKESLA